MATKTDSVRLAMARDAARPFMASHRHRVLCELIEALIERLILTTPGIEWVRYSFGEDHSGDPSIFLKSVISDEVAAELESLFAGRINFSTIMESIRQIEREVSGFEGVKHVYSNYRSLSETQMMKDPDWSKP